MTNANSLTNNLEDLNIKKSRTISDAQLIETGAQYVLDEGSPEARLELAYDQIANIEVDMRSDLAKTMNWSEAEEKRLDVICATLRSVPKEAHIYDIRSMNGTNIEIFLRALKVEKVYITSHIVTDRYRCAKIRLWLTPPVRKDYPDWSTSVGGGLAETDPLGCSWFGEDLVRKVTEGENSPFELIEQVKIKDPRFETNVFGGEAGYNRWLLRRKPIKS